MTLHQHNFAKARSIIVFECTECPHRHRKSNERAMWNILFPSYRDQIPVVQSGGGDNMIGRKREAPPHIVKLNDIVKQNRSFVRKYHENYFKS